MEYEIFKEKDISINSKEIDNIIKKFAKLFKIPSKNYLSIAFVSPKIIKKLNYQYRKIDKITDVLSFGGNSFTYINNQKYRFAQNKNLVFGDSNFLGEIIICYTQASCQAKKNRIFFDQEIKQLLTHGLVHLMGYDHQTSKEQKAMQDKELEILQ